MTAKKPIRSEEELVEVFYQLFDEIPSPQSSVEIEEYIREAGIDPDKFGSFVKEIALNALAESPLNWRNRDEVEVELARAQLVSIGQSADKDRESLLSTIDKVIEKIFATNPNLAPIHYRNRTELSVEDLVSLLQELKFLADKSNVELDLGD